MSPEDNQRRYVAVICPSDGLRATWVGVAASSFVYGPGDLKAAASKAEGTLTIHQAGTGRTRPSKVPRAPTVLHGVDHTGTPFAVAVSATNSDGDHAVDATGFIEVNDLTEVAAKVPEEFFNRDRATIVDPHPNTAFTYVVWNPATRDGYLLVADDGALPV